MGRKINSEVTISNVNTFIKFEFTDEIFYYAMNTFLLALLYIFILQEESLDLMGQYKPEIFC